MKYRNSILIFELGTTATTGKRSREDPSGRSACHSNCRRCPKPILIQGSTLRPTMDAFSHWLFIYRWAHHPVNDLLTFHVYLRSQGQVLAHAIGDNIVVESESISEVKALIHQHVSKKFHARIVPKIRLRYFNEEYL